MDLEKLSNYLEPTPERYEPPQARTLRFRKGQIDENLEAMNNDTRPLLSEDFEDSPFADRKTIENNEE